MTYRGIILLFALSITGALGKDLRILGGEGSDVTTYPFVVSFKYAVNNYIFCSGTLISDRHVLTSAHCLTYESSDYDDIRIFSGRNGVDASQRQINTIAQVFNHPSFTGRISATEVYRHDVAVVLARDAFSLNEFQNKIELPTVNVMENSIGYLFGWGSITYPITTFPQRLQKAPMRILPSDHCVDMFDFAMHSNQFCGYNSIGVGPCVGDSGGPLVIDGKLAGLLTFHFPCAQGLPDLYTNIYQYMDFITQIINPA